MINFIFNIFLAYFVINCGTSCSSAFHYACETPKKQPGTCIFVRECPQALKLLQKSPLSPDDIQYLRQSQCGFEGKNPKICCPFNKLEVMGSTSDQPQTSGPAVSNLLPTLDECGMFSVIRILTDEISLDGYPWGALLEYETPNGRGFMCSGVLINNRYVLTAAHCVIRAKTDKKWKLVNVRLGEHKLDTELDCVTLIDDFIDCADPVINVAVEEIIVKEEYDMNNQNRHHDIALLRLAENITFTDFIRPICLLPSPLFPHDLHFETVGWGISEISFQNNIRQLIKMKPMNNSECESLYENRGLDLTADGLCTSTFPGYQNKACFVDNGGVLMYGYRTAEYFKYFAVGVMSAAQRNCTMNNYLVIFTQVGEYIQWITDNLKP